MSFAEKLRISRKEKGYSQETLAEMLNVSRQTVTKWETENAYPEIRTLLLLSVILEKDLDWLFSDDLFAVRVSNNQSLQEQEKESNRDMKESNRDMDGQGTMTGRITRMAVEAVLEELQKPADKPMTRSGYSFIDEGRGWINQVYILYGTAAIGKTAFAMNVINNIIQEDGHAAYFDLSKPVKQAVRKLLGIAAQTGTGYRKEYSSDEKKRVMRAGKMLQDSYLYMEHVYEDSVEKIHEKCVNMDPDLDLIVIDGAEHLFSAKAVETGRDNDYWVSRELQEMVCSCGCPVLLLKEPVLEIEILQINPELIETMMEDLEMSDLIDGEVWLLQRADYYRLPEHHDHIATLTMKRRLIGEETGEDLLTGKMHFDPDTLRMTEIWRKS